VVTKNLYRWKASLRGNLIEKISPTIKAAVKNPPHKLI